MNKTLFALIALVVVSVTVPAQATSEARRKIRSWSLRMDRSKQKETKMAGVVAVPTAAEKKDAIPEESKSQVEANK